MRNSQEIKKQMREQVEMGREYDDKIPDELLLEVLLDVRDLLIKRFFKAKPK